MITNKMSAGRNWMGAFALAIMAVFAGSQSADAAVMHSNDNITFAKAETVTQVKKARVKKSYRKKASIKKKSSYRKKASLKKVYKRKKYTKRKKLRKSLKRVAKRSYRKRKSVRKSAKRKYAKKSYKRKSYKKRYAKRSSKRKSRSRSRNKSFGRGRGALMATLRSVKPAGLPLRLAAAVVTVESGWRVNARGSSGERGLMQLMPATARMMGARGNLYNPRVNMRAGTKYLHWCYRRARKNVAVTIGCYNRGPGLMWKWSGNPITRRYVSKVRRYMGRS